MKKWIILIIAVAVALTAAEARGTVNCNWVVKDGIKYYFQTDKAVYVLGENVEMLYRVTNLRDTPVTFKFAVRQQCSFEVRDGGTRIWRRPRYVNPALSEFTLYPGGSKQFTKDWDMINDNTGVLVVPGNYDVIGKLRWRVPVSVQIEIVPEPIEAIVDIKPNTINLKSKGKWITCYIQLPEDYNVADIDPNSVRLEGEIEADWKWFDEDEQVVMAKFSRAELQEMLEPGEVELTVTGELTDGTLFEGVDVIRVIDKGRKKTDD